MKQIYMLYILFAVTVPIWGTPLSIPDKEAQKIGTKIWHNECGSNKDLLVFWNQAEDFPSLGIGHFIWYPENNIGPFTETFPEFLAFAKQRGKQIPQWLEKCRGCPWKTRNIFLEKKASKQLKELKNLLLDTVDLQTQFMVHRLESALPRMLTYVPEEKHAHIKKQFYRIAHSPNGMYALIDYLNFKGEGTNPREQYNGQGWGLLQVLEKMEGKKKGNESINEFVQIARELLAQRTRSAPKEKHEEKFLRGWLNRVDTYLPK